MSYWIIQLQMLRVNICNIIAYNLFMQRLTAHLKRRNMKLLQQQQLSLPKILERPIKTIESTKIKFKQAKPIIKYISETTFSLDQDVTQDIMEAISQNHRRLNDTSVLVHTKHANKYSSSLTSSNKMQKKLASLKESNSKLANINNQTYFTSKNASIGKFYLQSILKDKGSFVKQYFNDINSRNSK